MGKYESWLSIFTKITFTQVGTLTQVSKTTLAFISAIQHLLTFQLTFNRILVCIKKSLLNCIGKNTSPPRFRPILCCSCSYLKDNCSLPLLQGTNSDFERIRPNGLSWWEKTGSLQCKRTEEFYCRYYAANVVYCWRSKYCTTLNGEMYMHGTHPILCKKYCILWVI